MKLYYENIRKIIRKVQNHFSEVLKKLWKKLRAGGFLKKFRIN